MLRRLVYVPLAVLGAVVAFAVSSAGGFTFVAPHILEPTGVTLNGAVTDLDISASGDCVVGESAATNDVGTDNNGSGTDIFLFDVAGSTWTRISNGNAASSDPSVSDDCDRIAWATSATDIGDTNAATVDIVVYDRSDNTIFIACMGGFDPDLSGNGSFVAYGFVADGQMYRTQVGGATVRVSSGVGGAAANSSTFNPRIDFSGNLVTFMSHGTNLVPSDTNAKPDIFLRDMSTTPATTELVSVTSSGGLPTGGAAGSLIPSISGNGRFVFYETDHPSITGGAGPASVLRDRTLSTNTVIAGNVGTLAVNDSGQVVIVTLDGLPADTDFDPDVYFVDPFTSQIEWLSSVGGAPASGGSFPFVGGPVIANDGTSAFTSTRTNLVSASPNGHERGFLLATTTGGGGGSTPPPVDFGVPAVVDLVVTKTASAPASGDSFAPGETITYTVEVVNAGTADAHGVFINDSLSAISFASNLPEPQEALSIALPGECIVFQHQAPGEILSAKVGCNLGTLPAGGGRKTVSYTVSLKEAEIPHTLTNRVEANGGFVEADPTDNVDDVSVTVDGSRECDEGDTCTAPPGTTTMTCTGEGTLCKAPREGGVMNTVCSEGANCGGTPRSELHECSEGAVCKDKVGEPNRFICSGELTFCSGVGTFTCTDGAFCRVTGTDSTATCTNSRLDLRGDGNSATLRGCFARIADGARRIILRSGNFVWLTGSGDVRATGVRNVVDTRNDERNTVTCTTAGGTVAIADRRRDSVNDCVQRSMDLALTEIELRDPPRFAEIAGIPEYEAGTPFEVRFTVVNNGPDPTPAHVTWELLYGIPLSGLLGDEELGLRLQGTPGSGPHFLVATADEVNPVAMAECEVVFQAVSYTARCPVGVIPPGETRTVRLWVSGSSLGREFLSHRGWVSDVPGAHCRPETDRDCGNNERDGQSFGIFRPPRRDSTPPKPPEQPPPVGPDLEVRITGTSVARPDQTLRYAVQIENIGSAGIDLPYAGLMFSSDMRSAHFPVTPDYQPSERPFWPVGAIAQFRTSGGRCDKTVVPHRIDGPRVGFKHHSAICRWDDLHMSPGEVRTIEVEASGGDITAPTQEGLYQFELDRWEKALGKRPKTFTESLAGIHIQTLARAWDGWEFRLSANTPWPLGQGETDRMNNEHTGSTKIFLSGPRYAPEAMRDDWYTRWQRPPRRP